MQGHQAGDEALQGLVSHLKAGLRKTDLVCRLGGDEFVLVLPGAVQEARQAMERLAAGAPVQFSYGIAQAGPQDNLSTAVLHADRAMYEHKQARRG